MKRKVSGFGQTAWREGGDDDTVANAMMIGWVGRSCPAHAVSLHALTAKHNKTATMVTSQGNSKVLPQTGSTAILLAHFN